MYESATCTKSMNEAQELIHSLLFQLDKTKLKQGSRVALDMTTLTIMRQLPREVDPLVHNMSTEDPGDISYSSVGGWGSRSGNSERSERSNVGVASNMQLFMREVWSVS